MGHTVVVGLHRCQGVLPGAIGKSGGLPAQDMVPRHIQLDGSDQDAGQVRSLLKSTCLYAGQRRAIHGSPLPRHLDVEDGYSGCIMSRLAVATVSASAICTWLLLQVFAAWPTGTPLFALL